jgi:hypothetical protein
MGFTIFSPKFGVYEETAKLPTLLRLAGVMGGTS